jgi:hypothetical protein
MCYNISKCVLLEDDLATFIPFMVILEVITCIFDDMRKK